MIPTTTSFTYRPTNIVVPILVNGDSPSNEPTNDSDSSHVSTISPVSKVTEDSQAGQFKKRRSSVMTAPNQWHSVPVENDSIVSSEIDEAENDAASDTDEINRAGDDSDDDCDVEHRYIDYLKIALTNFHGMTCEKMTLALAGSDETIEALFDDISCLISSCENSDAVRDAKQFIINFAKTQSADFRFKIFNAHSGAIFLSGLDLSGMNFEGMDLSGANFSNSNLSGANFSRTVLSGVSCNETNLESAVFNGANLEYGHFEKANLSGAKLNASSFYFARFYGADLRGIDFTGLNLREAVFTNANMESACFNGANLRGARFDGANLKKADFSGIVLAQVNLSKAILVGAIFDGANFERANLSGAYLRNVNFIGLKLHGKNFSGPDFSGANLSGANFKGMNLSGVNLRDANLNGADLSGTNLTEVSFGTANLGSANLRLANLHRVNFGDSFLYGADLRGAHIMSVEFSNRCGVDSYLFVVAERNNHAFLASSWRDTSVKTRNHNGLNIFEDPFVPRQSGVAPSNQVGAVTFSSARSMVSRTAQQARPAPPRSFWGWISSIPNSAGQFFRSVFRRLWGTS